MFRFVDLPERQEVAQILEFLRKHISSKFYAALIRLKLKGTKGSLATSFKPKIIGDKIFEQVSFAKYFQDIMYTPGSTMVENRPL